jgi:ribosomal protein L29
MDFADLKNKSINELKELQKELHNKLWQLRMKAHARELKQVHEFKTLRKAVARIQMLLTRKP